MRLARITWASAALGIVRAVFPFSLRGLLLTLLAAGLLIEGMARADLAALFWGASFILYSLYAVAASHLARLALERRKKNDPDILSVILPASGLEPGQEGEAHVSARMPRSLPPGFILRFMLPLQWHSRSLRAVSGRLGRGKTQGTVRFRAGRRGMYQCEAAVLEIHDVLGFTRSSVSVPMAASVAVFPSAAAPGPWRILAEGADPAVTTSRRRRSDELLEVRKYYPGDDVRRLNWKVFAHSRELFLRVGEETPPPESRLLFILDSSANSLIPDAFSDDYLDSLVDSCAAAMTDVCSRGMTILLSRHGARDCRVYSEESKTGLLSACADVFWAESGWLPPLPSIPRLHCAVFSTPGSPGLGQIMAQVRDKGWSASLFLKEPPRADGAARLRARDLLFLPETPDRQSTRGGRMKAAAMRRAGAALDEALARDLSEYGAAGRKGAHALEI